MNTRQLSVCAVVVAVGLLTIVVRSGWSEDTPKPATGATPAAEQPVRRLPFGYGQLGLSDEQKEAVYQIQDKFRAQVEELEKQLAAIRAKQTAEIDVLLTDGQKLRLKELRQQMEERRQRGFGRRRSGDNAANPGTPNGDGAKATDANPAEKK